MEVVQPGLNQMSKMLDKLGFSLIWIML